MKILVDRSWHQPAPEVLMVFEEVV